MIPRIDSGITIIDNSVSAILPAAAPYYSVNPLQIWTAIGSFLWLAGIAAMLIYCVISTVLLRRKLCFALPCGGGVYETDNIKTPLVFGLFRPRIYLPTGLTGDEREYILLHEQTHVRRRDYLVKIFAFFVLCVHWFNPLVWAAFALMTADMEMSCDERVLRELGGAIKADYSMSLVRLAAKRRIIGASPLAFGEGGVKERVKHVLNFKRRSRTVIAAAIVLAAALAVGLAVNGAGGGEKGQPEATISYQGLSSTITLGDSKHIPYVELGSKISLNFGTNRPDAVSVIEVIANADGSRKYSAPTDKTLEVVYSGSNLVSFDIEKNFGDMLSSNSDDYLSGNAFRWYRILCDDGEIMTEYALWLRTDPAVIFARAPASADTAPTLTDDDLSMSKRAAIDKIMSSAKYLADIDGLELTRVETELPVTPLITAVKVFTGEGASEREIKINTTVADFDWGSEWRYEIPLGDVDNALLSVTFDDGETRFYSPLYQDFMALKRKALDEELLSSWTSLEDLPAGYGAYENLDNAVADGVYVNVQGAEI
jgi:hypothetical protein